MKSAIYLTLKPLMTLCCYKSRLFNHNSLLIRTEWKTSFPHGIWTQLSSLSIQAAYQFIHKWCNFSHPHVNLLNSLWDIRLCDILGYDNTQSGRFTRFCTDVLPSFVTLCSSETLITIYHTTHSHNPEDYNINVHCCENIKSCIHRDLMV